MIRVENSLLPVIALSHPGMKGKNNEDRYGVSAYQTETNPPASILLAVLSDGSGGHRAGEVASEMAVDVISQFVAESDGSDPAAIMRDAIHLASDTIHQQSQENNEQHGMGATVACAWIAEDRLYTATVGDSRIYLMRSDQILQLSVDHTWIQEALEMGLIQPDQVNGHPNAHVIRRYLGSPAHPEVDFRMRVYEGESDQQSIANQGMRLLPNDRLLLCSDGLTDLVSDAEILAMLREKPMEEAVSALIDLANQRGGHDNITLVLIHVPPPIARQQKARKPQAATAAASFSRFLVIGCLGAILLGVLAGGVLGGWILFNRDATPTPTTPPSLQRTPTVASLTRTATRTSTRRVTQSPTATNAGVPLEVPTPTPSSPAGPAGPSLTPWPTNTPSTPLPVVTVLSP